jgi:hypothetical protein
MIDKMDLIQRLGKPRATQFMIQNRSNQPTGFDKTRGIRGRIKNRSCQHGVTTIDNYLETGDVCDKCNTGRPTKSKDFKPYFNIGLGAYVESRQEEKKLAKTLNYVEAG